MGSKRVVITGLSAITPLSPTLSGTFDALIAHKSGIRSITPQDFQSHSTKIKNAAFLDTWDKAAWISKLATMKIVPNALSLCALSTALADSNWQPQSEEESDRSGLLFSSTRSFISELRQSLIESSKQNYGRLDRFYILKSYPGLSVSGAIPYKFKGFSLLDSSGNCGGLNTISEAYKAIALGDIDVGLSVAVEAEHDVLMFESLSKGEYGVNLTDENPASKPFSRLSRGWVPGMGAAGVVVEELEHALRRGAKIYAEVAGHSLVSGAGEVNVEAGFKRAIEQAVKTEKIDTIFTEASGMMKFDEAEANAIWVKWKKSVKVCNVKAALGHSESASSLINAAVAVWAIKNGVVPPCFKIEEGVRDLDFVEEMRNEKINAAVVNAANYDGTSYAAVCFKKYEI